MARAAPLPTKTFRWLNQNSVIRASTGFSIAGSLHDNRRHATAVCCISGLKPSALASLDIDKAPGIGGVNLIEYPNFWIFLHGLARYFGGAAAKAGGCTPDSSCVDASLRLATVPTSRLSTATVNASWRLQVGQVGITNSLVYVIFPLSNVPMLIVVVSFTAR